MYLLLLFLHQQRWKTTLSPELKKNGTQTENGKSTNIVIKMASIALNMELADRTEPNRGTNQSTNSPNRQTIIVAPKTSNRNNKMDTADCLTDCHYENGYASETEEE